jgi:hypothetical protein
MPNSAKGEINDEKQILLMGNIGSEAPATLMASPTKIPIIVLKMARKAQPKGLRHAFG